MKQFLSVAVSTCLMLTVSTGLSQPRAAAAARDYRQDMRDFVQGISVYAKQWRPTFLVIPQNGHDLLTFDGEPTGPVVTTYLSAIDGVGQEDLFYGYNNDNQATPRSERTWMMGFLDIARAYGKPVLVTDYCWTRSYMDNSYYQNGLKGYLSFAANHRDLDVVPGYPLTPYHVNSSNITSLAQARNFLYLIDPGRFSSKSAFLDAIRRSSYDVVLIDLFYDTAHPLTATDVASIRTKAGGGRRLVIAYMSIGEAEDYRYYWQSAWTAGNPLWLDAEDPNWPGDYAVHYWDKGWQNMIYGNDQSYLKRILNAGFDGVYLDRIDMFEYYEGWGW